MSHEHVEKRTAVRVDFSVRDPLLAVGDEASSVDGLGNGARAVRDIWDTGELRRYLE